MLPNRSKYILLTIYWPEKKYRHSIYSTIGNKVRRRVWTEARSSYIMFLSQFLLTVMSQYRLSFVAA